VAFCRFRYISQEYRGIKCLFLNYLGQLHFTSFTSSLPEASFHFTAHKKEAQEHFLHKVLYKYVFTGNVIMRKIQTLSVLKKRALHEAPVEIKSSIYEYLPILCL